MKLYAEKPDEAEIVGVVSSTSYAGFTGQQFVDYAIEEMKALAAKIGANSVVLARISHEVRCIGV